MIAEAKVNCFPAGTPVATADGDRPIELNAAGDLVWAEGHPGGAARLQKVVRTFEHDACGRSSPCTSGQAACR